MFFCVDNANTKPLHSGVEKMTSVEYWQIWINEMADIIEFHNAKNNEVPYKRPGIIWQTFARLIRVENTCKGKRKRTKACKMPPINQFSSSGLQELQKISAEIMKLLGANSIKQYELATALFGNTITHCCPATVIEFLENIESSIMESKRIKFIEASRK
jgi:hypothetical protein